jgi:microcin C transport system substrate-binding protein
MRRLAVIAALVLIAAAPAAAEDEGEVYVGHGISMYGDLKYGPDFTHFDYVNPDAPKGGDVKLGALFSFDSLNPFILKGTTAAGMGGLLGGSLVYESLMTGSEDEAFSEYGQIAETVEVPADRSWVAFNLRPEARWHDGEPITADDVVWTFESLMSEGHPLYRAYYANVVSVEKIDDHKVKFTFDQTGNRELPLIMGQLPVLPKHYYETHTFNETTLEPPLGSGPYRVKSVDPGRSITYERVEDYWGQDLPVNKGQNNFDTLRYDYYRDGNIAVEALKAHEYDFRMENNSRVWATAYTGPAVRDGLLILAELPDHTPTGMQAFIFNTRRDKFADPRVRQALGYAFDFEWSNKNLFYDQYARTKSYFSNSELAATELPSEAELALLEPYRDQLPPEVFTEVYEPPVTDGSGNIRSNLHAAKQLLDEAGWTVQNGVLTGPEGQPMEIEILLVQPEFERVVQPLARNLERLGAKVSVRIVDASQYQNRLDQFDFDLIVSGFGQSLSPGNEQRDFWSSEAADIEGSRNLIGIKSPVIDALIDDIIFAEDRASLIAATRALDRVLLWNHYVIPNWHSRVYRVAYWDKFARPDVQPLYGLGFNTWWVVPELEEELIEAEEALEQ